MKTEEEIENEGLQVGMTYNDRFMIKDVTIKNDSNDLYELIDTTKPLYKYQLRMKAFITDFARVKIAKVALEDIDDVIRIQTDGIVYSSNIYIDKTNFVKEESKTGRFKWVNVNKFIKL